MDFNQNNTACLEPKSGPVFDQLFVSQLQHKMLVLLDLIYHWDVWSCSWLKVGSLWKAGCGQVRGVEDPFSGWELGCTSDGIHM